MKKKPSNTILYIVYFVIIVVIVYIIYKFMLSKYISKYIIVNVLSNFTEGNFIIYDSNNNIVVKKINNNKMNIPIIKILNEESFYDSILTKGELGLGESYVRKDWISITPDLTLFLDNIYLNNHNKNIPKTSILKILSKSMSYDKDNIKHHYDVGNDFYMLFLTDKLSAYSCGFWFNDDDTLEDAQFNKIDTIIYKMNTNKNNKILDIGCGWGKIANYVSHKTNCTVYGITISDEQEKYAKENYDNNKVIIRNMDYRNLLQTNEKYNYIYSIGMFEHVRYENYDTFFKVIKHCLNENGVFVLHTIINTDKDTKKISEEGSTFITKHIFPGGQIPKTDWILEKVYDNNMSCVHYEGFGGQHYARTLKEWKKNMLENKNYIINNYSEELLLKYEYYFSSSEAGFDTGILGIGHFVIVNNNMLTLDNSFNYEL